jgi:hypothetical protein
MRWRVSLTASLAPVDRSKWQIHFGFLSPSWFERMSSAILSEHRRASLRCRIRGAIVCCFAMHLALHLGSALGWAADPSREMLQFNRDIRPILSEFCFSCHGPDGNHRQGDLRLDLADDAMSRRILVPGDPHASELIARIESIDDSIAMPPPSTKKSLRDDQKRLLRRWIEQGATYQKHWAYEPPAKLAVPASEHPVDYWIGRRLEQLGWSPAPEADRRALIRRLYSDLIGLPPSPHDVEIFMADASPDAYEKLVEKLLSSEHYGERMAMGWLDAVRYADTIGYHSDNPRNVWPYRDWVIRSFNGNKRFDRFTLEQIAGDLLPDADQESRVGSAFNRLILSTEEGGAQPKDYEARMLADRVRAVGTVWLGQTTGCAQCHDHKFDPITMRDFYALGAFFADIQEGLVAPREEGMPVPTHEERDNLLVLDREVELVRARFETLSKEIDAAQRAWEDAVRAETYVFDSLRPESEANDADKKVARSVSQAIKGSKRSEAQRREIQRFFHLHVDPQHREPWLALEQAEKSRDDFYRRIPKCLVSTANGAKRTVRILPRGNWMDESGEIMRPGFPSYLPQPASEDREWTRLDLARWLVARENPLTARVVVNRLWKHFFGTGLSKTLDDLGTQGEPPSHPELLDHLACEFMDSGWDWKHMVRLIVRSRTYRQSSVATAELLTADPANRELARQSPFRLDAELIRDQSLRISGLLATEIGGPSVKPYQPAGYWEHLNFPVRSYQEDRGSGQHRRGLYTWWQRTFLHPSLLAFDAPSREECCAERTRSNIPQQALVLLNDPTYVEAARGFAIRILREGGDSTESRIGWAYRWALQRMPRDEEIQRLSSLVIRHRERYAAEPAAASQLLSVGIAAVPGDLDRGELAAWTHVARVLLSLHETITRS